MREITEQLRKPGKTYNWQESAGKHRAAKKARMVTDRIELHSVYHYDSLVTFQFQKFQALIKDWPADLYSVSPIISAVQVRKYAVHFDIYLIGCFDM